MIKFKVGQQVVCIDVENTEYHDYMDSLVYGKIYTVKESLSGAIVIDDTDFGFGDFRFATIPEYRRMKIKSLYE